MSQFQRLGKWAVLGEAAEASTHKQLAKGLDLMLLQLGLQLQKYPQATPEFDALKQEIGKAHHMAAHHWERHADELENAGDPTQAALVKAMARAHREKGDKQYHQADIWKRPWKWESVTENGDSDGDEKESAGREPTPEDVKKIQDFVKSTPGLSDGQFHEFCEKLGVDVHKAEEVAYAMARQASSAEEAVRRMYQMALVEKKDELPVGKHNDVPDSEYDPEELKMGIKVEMEHIPGHYSKEMATRIATAIAKDHLAEIKDYYTRLVKMEKEAGVKD